MLTAAAIADAVNRHQPALGCAAADGVRGDVVDGLDNRAAIRGLHAHWRASAPEGGPHLWSARSWCTLVWQPVYATVLAVHVAGALPALAGSGVLLRDGFAAGCRLAPDAAVRQGPPDELIAPAGPALRGWLDRRFAEFAAVVPMHPKMAMRLAADYAVAAVLSLRGRDAQPDAAAVEAWAARWLDALGLPGASGVMGVTLKSGERHLALHRKVCCQEFRCEGGVLCSTCPKLPLPDRIARIRQEAESRASSAG